MLSCYRNAERMSSQASDGVNGEHHDKEEQCIPHVWFTVLGCVLFSMIVGPMAFAGQRLAHFRRMLMGLAKSDT
jgi:hypothetical protein